MSSRRKPRARESGGLGDLRVELVADDGNMLLRLPGGAAVTLHISRDMIPYYRRLVPPRERTRSS